MKTKLFSILFSFVIAATWVVGPVHGMNGRPTGRPKEITIRDSRLVTREALELLKLSEGLNAGEKDTPLRLNFNRSNITDRHIIDIVSVFQECNVVEFHCSACEEVTDIGASLVLNKFRRLEVFNVSLCRSVTQRVYELNSVRRPPLRALNTFGCTLINNDTEPQPQEPSNPTPRDDDDEYAGMPGLIPDSVPGFWSTGGGTLFDARGHGRGIPSAPKPDPRWLQMARQQSQEAREMRQKQKDLQGEMSDDEALRIALAMSRSESPQTPQAVAQPQAKGPKFDLVSEFRGRIVPSDSLEAFVCTILESLLVAGQPDRRFFECNGRMSKKVLRSRDARFFQLALFYLQGIFCAERELIRMFDSCFIDPRFSISINLKRACDLYIAGNLCRRSKWFSKSFVVRKKAWDALMVFLGRYGCILSQEIQDRLFHQINAPELRKHVRSEIEILYRKRTGQELPKQSQILERAVCQAIEDMEIKSELGWCFNSVVRREVDNLIRYYSDEEEEGEESDCEDEDEEAEGEEVAQNHIANGNHTVNDEEVIALPERTLDQNVDRFAVLLLSDILQEEEQTSFFGGCGRFCLDGEMLYFDSLKFVRVALRFLLAIISDGEYKGLIFSLRSAFPFNLEKCISIKIGWVRGLIEKCGENKEIGPEDWKRAWTVLLECLKARGCTIPRMVEAKLFDYYKEILKRGIEMRRRERNNNDVKASRDIFSEKTSSPSHTHNIAEQEDSESDDEEDDLQKAIEMSRQQANSEESELQRALEMSRQQSNGDENESNSNENEYRFGKITDEMIAQDLYNLFQTLLTQSGNSGNLVNHSGFILSSVSVNVLQIGYGMLLLFQNIYCDEQHKEIAQFIQEKTGFCIKNILMSKIFAFDLRRLELRISPQLLLADKKFAWKLLMRFLDIYGCQVQEDVENALFEKYVVQETGSSVSAPVVPFSLEAPSHAPSPPPFGAFTQEDVPQVNNDPGAFNFDEITFD